MGQRANFIIVENGQRTLYYDHWCANHLDSELFWGPDLALEFVRELGPAGDEYWLDEVWCEGAALIDLDARHLLFYGGEDTLYEVPRQRALVALMAHSWPGWRIEWARDGLISIVQCLGLDLPRFLVKEREPERFSINEAFEEDNEVLFSWRRDGGVGAGAISPDLSALVMGPAHLAEIGNLAKRPHWSNERLPVYGVHADFDASTLSVWSASPQPLALERAAAAWPGWTLIHLNDRFEDQLALCDQAVSLPVPDLAEIRRGLLRGLRGRATHESKFNPNPTQSIVAHLTASGSSVTQINPATAIARAPVDAAAAKLALLDAIERSFV